MAWAHFTDFLAEGTLLTHAQRNELLDAFAERVAAVHYGSVYTVPSEVLASPLISDLVRDDDNGQEIRLMEALNNLSVRYVRADRAGGAPFPATSGDYWYVPGATDTTNLLVDAGAGIGLSAGDVAALRASPLVDARARWNLLRKAIQLLAYPRIFDVPGSGGRAYDKGGDSDPDWGTARDSFLGAAEDPIIPAAPNAPRMLGSYASGLFSLGGVRRELDLLIPEHTAFWGGYRLWYWHENISDVASPQLVCAFGGGSQSIVASDTGGNQVRVPISATERTATGPQVLDMRYKAWDDSAEADAFEPSGEGSLSALTGGGGLHAAPTFTHP